MNLSHRPTLRHSHVLLCVECRCSISSHDPSCQTGKFAARIQALESQYRYIWCPVCKKGDVELNDDDLYECRACHGLFCTGERDESFPRHLLIYERGDTYFPVQLLPQKGTGQFHVDLELAKVRDEQRRYLRSAAYRRLVRRRK